MWRAALLAGLLLGSATANVFTEGGSSGPSNSNRQVAKNVVEEEAAEQQPIIEYDEEELQKVLQQQAQISPEEEQLREWLLSQYAKQQQQQEEEEEREREEAERRFSDELLKDGSVDDIVEELTKTMRARAAAPEAELIQKQVKVAPKEEKKKPEAPKHTAKPLQQQQPKQEEEPVPAPQAAAAAVPPSMQKKGQSEFVSFVDPDVSLRSKNVPQLEKRKEQVRVERMRNDGSLLYVAVGTVMLVGTIGGAIGGAVYYRRKQDEPDDQEYAPYAGTGPRKLKPGGAADKAGDDTLAYKAQLHHYQQAKQKIICGEANAGMAGDSEEEADEVDDENNFSVYECPGLAPTGDLEVHNPNFAGSQP